MQKKPNSEGGGVRTPNDTRPTLFSSADAPQIEGQISTGNAQPRQHERGEQRRDHRLECVTAPFTVYSTYKLYFLGNVLQIVYTAIL